MQLNELTASFAAYWPLDEQAITALEDCVVSKAIKRKEYILRAGEACDHFTFVVRGCFKMYKVDDGGNQHNLQFATENHWIADYGSFYGEEPSELCIEALEASDIRQIPRNNLFYLYDNFPVFDRNFRIIIENTFIEQQKRVLQTISSTAEERYLYFLEKYPELAHRVSNVQIASYIGVTPEFLSTIRRKIALK
ncbi:Crp/Fnr family transcriptional regulator [Fulvivirga sp. M361]|uniref:Crp/Fnr family transcriptional regulator n=1 Tax=Fulvivirga sp. M361 TaxID=2594266 RepID=UPI00117A7C0D|nr:Crp/Fnr family transcriptional regulator [Fulvivirga sp. M361]TRX61411.1 Crp/Fnr family transcriptional regulator [Fulvivirga sp. M361]